MPELFSLLCPTCGASLQIAGDNQQFHCGHCGNNYLLDHKISELDEAARKQLAPMVTYTQTVGQWLKVANQDVFLHGVEYTQVKDDKVLYIEVAYENKTAQPIQYRHDQWCVFDTRGHTFEPVKDFTHPHLYAGDKFYLGMTRALNPGMQLRGWLAFLLPKTSVFEYLQFAAGWPLKTVEFRIPE